MTTPKNERLDRAIEVVNLINTPPTERSAQQRRDDLVTVLDHVAGAIKGLDDTEGTTGAPPAVEEAVKAQNLAAMGASVPGAEQAAPVMVAAPPSIAAQSINMEHLLGMQMRAKDRRQHLATLRDTIQEGINECDKQLAKEGEKIL